MITTLEIICLAIVTLFIGLQCKYQEHPARFLRHLSLLAIASWLGEDSVIHTYRFYGYSPQWSLFLDQVPLLIVLIWPVVIYSAWNLAGYLGPGRVCRLALVGGAIVLADASLIEPIAVQAGMWQWFKPGLFGIPPIGILGWAYFAGCCMFVLESNNRAKRNSYWDVLVLVIPVAFTHFMLMLTWWGALRWVNGRIPSGPVVAVAWAVSVFLTCHACRKEPPWRIPSMEMFLRIPAALFFFVILAMYGRTELPLIAYAIAFVPPYMVLTIRHTAHV